MTGNFEAGIERFLRHKIIMLGGMSVKLFGSALAGLPDRLVLLPSGRIYFVELKSLGKKPRPIQLKRHEQLRALGFDVRVIDSIDAVDKFIREVSV